MAAVLAPEDRLINRAPVAETIVERVIPDWRTSVPLDQQGRWWQLKEARQHAHTLIAREKELRDFLGDNRPRRDANRLHPWVWEAAQSLWTSGYYRHAVVEALMRVNAETLQKAGGSPLGETRLFHQLFSTNPAKPGDVRLRLHPDDGTDSYTDIHRGVRALAEGLFAGVRNISAHTVEETDVDEQHALEQLATRA